MEKLNLLLPLIKNKLPEAAIFLSGSGTNAEKILQRLKKEAAENIESAYKVSVLVTDAPESSRALELGKEYGIPVVAEDIRAFYRANGEERVSIRSPKAQELRRLWSDSLRQKLSAYDIDFAIFAGFVPLTDLTADFPCLNVHPGDLTYLKDGQRFLIGLHSLPIELAILEGLSGLRSSVILARPYSGSGEDMDNGPILGISTEVAIDLQKMRLSELQEISQQRAEKRPIGGYKDKLAEIAAANLEALKIGGDWLLLPEVVEDFAKGRYAINENQQLHYKMNEKFYPIETVVFDGKNREVIFNG